MKKYIFFILFFSQITIPMETAKKILKRTSQAVRVTTSFAKYGYKTHPKLTLFGSLGLATANCAATYYYADDGLLANTFINIVSIGIVLLGYIKTVLEYRDKNTAQLISATIEGREQRVRGLIKRGATVDDYAQLGLTAFQYALLYDRPEMAQLLNNLGANSGKRTRQLYTCLMLLSCRLIVPNVSTPSQSIRWLIENRVNLEEKSSSGKTALHYACFCDDITPAVLLCDAQADMNVLDEHFFMPLEYAILEHYGPSKKDHIQYLLALGARTTSPHNGQTALQLATNCDCPEKILDLLRAPKRPHIPDSARDVLIETFTSKQNGTSSKPLLPRSTKIIFTEETAKQTSIPVLLHAREIGKKRRPNYGSKLYK